MNSILSNQQTTIMQPRNFKEFAAQWTPDQAKQRVEEMLRTGQISQEQFEQAKQIVNLLLKR